MKQYDVLIARADRETLDLITALSGTLPITGILDEDDSVALYFDEAEFRPEYAEELEGMLPQGSAVRFERAKVEEQNWNSEFEKSLEPVRVTDELVITQSWNPVEERDGEMVVVIDPKMSFGTGHHESTRLIARLMMRTDLAGKSVLDAGTGTGSLAIIAAKRGAGKIVAFDNNEWAVENTLENLELNGATDRVETILGELEDIEATGFDMVLANLHRNLIIRLLPGFIAKFAGPDSCLLTSGVLIEDYDSLLEAARRHRLVPVDEERENEWVATRFGTEARNLK